MTAINSSGDKMRRREGDARSSCPFPQTLSDFHALLNSYSQRQFTGRLDVEVASGEQWYLYLSLGRFIWASGGDHPTRRWHRQIVRTVTAMPLQELTPLATARFECWDYHLLCLCAYHKLIPARNVVALIRQTVAEILFDLAQAIEFAAIARAAFYHPDSPRKALIRVTPRAGVRPSTAETGILPRAWTADVESTQRESQRLWQSWRELGLENCSPNLAPLLVKPERLQRQVSRETYANFVALANGKRTLRDLAALMRCDLLSLARSLLPYLQAESLVLVEIPDLIAPSFVRDFPRPQCALSARPTLACIDDCPETCHFLTTTAIAAGYEAFAIQEAVRAMPLLLERKPNYIFLDLTMPIINGYEVCAQIRRVGAFKEIPIIILTGHDGLVDRIRAKVVGATDFLSKPIAEKKVLETLQKYNPKKKAIEVQQLQKIGLQ